MYVLIFFHGDFPEIIFQFSPHKNLWGKIMIQLDSFFRRVGSMQPTTYRETAVLAAHQLRGCYFATSSKYSDHYACNVRLPRWGPESGVVSFQRMHRVFFRDQMITSG